MRATTAVRRHCMPRVAQVLPVPAAWIAGGLVLVALAVTAPARAQDTGPAAEARPAGSAYAAGAAPGKDPTVIIARTVQPRIAYRGVPLEDNPIHSEATTFPGIVFHGTMGSLMGELVEEELGQHGSAGVMAGAAVQSTVGRALPGLAGSPLTGAGAGHAAPAMGPGASVGGAAGGVGAAVGNATANIGSLVSTSVMQAVGKTQGGGP